MIRGDNIVCGTTSTGTGTLTLAATPVAPGGVDFDVFARAIGFGNSAAVLVSYTIIEYTDSTFATAKQHEKGWGTLTLGASAGIANATLARGTLQTSATSLNSQPATQNLAPGTGISISTAANTLVFIGPSAADMTAYSPFYNNTANGDNKGASAAGTNGGNLVAVTASGTELIQAFQWQVPMPVKTVTVKVSAVYTGGTSNVYCWLYAIGSNGIPGKLLANFGALGTAGAALATAGYIKSAALSSPLFLTPGEYFMSIVVIYSGGSGTPSLFGGPNALLSGRMGAWTSVFNSLVAPHAFFGQGGWASNSPTDPWTNANGNTSMAANNAATGFLLAPS